jgi:hypothetical protein
MVKTQTSVYDSSTIEASTYDYTTKDLFVVFKHATYLYSNVNVDDYEQFRNAESQGRALNQFIKKYSYQKLENA